MSLRVMLAAGAATMLIDAAAATSLPHTPQVYRGGTDVVALSVTVTDPAGRHVPNLQAADFQLFEDGVRQEISLFASHADPVSLSLLVDSSASMELDSRLSIAQQAVTGFVGRLGERDVAQILDFDSQIKILAPFTSDRAELERALRLMKPGGSTSLYNAIYTAISELKREGAQARDSVRRRQAIVLLSDGEDTSSIVPYEDVLDLSKRSEVNVYAIAMAPKGSRSSGWNEAEFVLKSLTRDAGGRVFLVSDPQQLPAIYTQISEELSHQYSVGYVPRNTKRDGAWRRVTLQVMKRDAMARTRSGYYAAASSR